LLVGGNFVLAGKHADILLAELPPIVHIRKNRTRQRCAGVWNG
jgi:hypothetical protein